MSTRPKMINLCFSSFCSFFVHFFAQVFEAQAFFAQHFVAAFFGAALAVFVAVFLVVAINFPCLFFNISRLFYHKLNKMQVLFYIFLRNCPLVGAEATNATFYF